MPFASRKCVCMPLFAVVMLLPRMARAQDTTARVRDTTFADSAARQRQDSMARSIQRLAPVVTVSRDVGRSVLDLPYAITSVRPDSLRPGQQHLSARPDVFRPSRSRRRESHESVAGRPRLPIRGFGSRSSFGVRSVRILRDGMPLTNADGQTPLDYLDLETIGRIEVIRGTASSLYGNASGGVIDMRSADPPSDAFAAQLRSQGGSYETSRFTGVGRRLVHQWQLLRRRRTHLRRNNYREYSAQRLTNGYGRTLFSTGGTDLRAAGDGNRHAHRAKSRCAHAAQADSAPRMADPSQVRKKARKEVSMLQIGLSARHALRGSGELFAQIYGGGRSLYNPLTFAIVDVGRAQWGGGARATRAAQAVRTRRTARASASTCRG